MNKGSKLLLNIGIMGSLLLASSCMTEPPETPATVGSTSPASSESTDSEKYAFTSKSFIDSASHSVDATVAGTGSDISKTDTIPAELPIDATVPIPIEGQVTNPPPPADIPIDATVPIPIEGQVSIPPPPVNIPIDATVPIPIGGQVS